MHDASTGTQACLPVAAKQNLEDVSNSEVQEV